MARYLEAHGVALEWLSVVEVRRRTPPGLRGYMNMAWGHEHGMGEHMNEAAPLFFWGDPGMRPGLCAPPHRFPVASTFHLPPSTFHLPPSSGERQVLWKMHCRCRCCAAAAAAPGDEDGAAVDAADDDVHPMCASVNPKGVCILAPLCGRAPPLCGRAPPLCGRAPPFRRTDAHSARHRMHACARAVQMNSRLGVGA
eukprot:360686-Chlamydomonas_euryale.AAC.7